MRLASLAPARNYAALGSAARNNGRDRSVCAIAISRVCTHVDGCPERGRAADGNREDHCLAGENERAAAAFIVCKMYYILYFTLNLYICDILTYNSNRKACTII